MRKAVRLGMLLLTAAAWGCGTWHHLTQGDQTAQGKTAGFFFQEENDSIAPGNRDKFYTQGLRLGKTVNPAENPALVESAANRACVLLRCSEQSTRTIWTTGVAQILFTPDDITIAAPQPHDRPWAAFLYLDNTLRITENNPGVAPHWQHVLELQSGIIGPEAGGRWAQGALHDQINSPRPAGWGNQIPTRVGLQLIYLYNRRFAAKYADLLPFAGGGAGNTMVYANAGTFVRLGANMSTFMTTGVMQGTLLGGNSTRPNWEGWVYGGIDARYVGYNLFLDRGAIRLKHDNHDLLFGASGRYRNYRVTYNTVRRGREFTDPLGPPFRQHNFGSLVLSYELILK